MNEDSEVKVLLEKVKNGTATYKEANEYAVRVGENLAKAYKMNVSADVLPEGKSQDSTGKKRSCKAEKN